MILTEQHIEKIVEHTIRTYLTENWADIEKARAEREKSISILDKYKPIIDKQINRYGWFVCDMYENTNKGFCIFIMPIAENMDATDERYNASLKADGTPGRVIDVENMTSVIANIVGDEYQIIPSPKAQEKPKTGIHKICLVPRAKTGHF